MAPKWSSQLLMSGLNNELGAKAAPFLSAFVATRLVIGLNLHTGRFKWLDGLACPAGFLAWHQKWCSNVRFPPTTVILWGRWCNTTAIVRHRLAAVSGPPGPENRG